MRLALAASWWGLRRLSGSPTSPVQSALAEAVRSGRLLEDGGAQRAAAIELDAVFTRLTRFAEARRRVPPGAPPLLPEQPPPDVAAAQRGRVPKGLYLYGGVGTGKSLLADTLFSAVAALRGGSGGGGASLEPPPSSLLAPAQNGGLVPARRVHFHAFMLEMHARIFAVKQAQLACRDAHRARRALHGQPGAHLRSEAELGLEPRTEREAIVQVAREVAREAWLLCFDELQVTDVSDAMTVQRLFGQLFRDGVIIVATSNRPPEDLYKDGLNRGLFLPFIDLLRAHCKVHELGGATDFRFRERDGAAHSVAAAADAVGGASPRHSRFISPADGDVAARVLLAHLDELAPGWARATAQAQLAAAGPPGVAARLEAALAALPVVAVPLAMGRELRVRSPLEAPHMTVASFDELCARPVGAADFLGLSRRFRAVFLLGVPLLTPLLHNEARRLITLVDVIYEHRAATALVVSAAAPLGTLFASLLRLRLRRPGPAGDVASALEPALGPSPVEAVGRARAAELDSSRAEGEEAEADGLDVEVEVGGEEDGAAGGGGGGGDGGAGGGPKRAVVSVVTSAAERAALGELAFACRRAASRLHEMTVR